MAPKAVSNPRRPRGRPKQSDTSVPSEEELLRIILDMFAERGYEGASIRDLARAANVSHNLLPLRFGNKEQLWRRAVDFAVEELRTATAKMANLEEDNPSLEVQLRERIVCLLVALAKTPTLQQMVLREGNHHTSRLEYLLSSLNKISDIIKLNDLYERGAREGLFKDLPAMELMILITQGGATVLGLSTLRSFTGLPELTCEKEIEETARRIVEVFMSGVVI